ncbi:hypothetical protein D3C78_981830 [compost metagenome]
MSPATASNIASDDTLDIDALSFAGNHDAVFQQLRLGNDIAKLRHIGMHDMVGLNASCLLEPIRRQTIQYIALVRHGRIEHIVKRRDAIGDDDQEMLAKIVQLPHLSFVNKRSLYVINSC